HERHLRFARQRLAEKLAAEENDNPQVREKNPRVLRDRAEANNKIGDEINKPNRANEQTAGKHGKAQLADVTDHPPTVEVKLLRVERAEADLSDRAEQDQEHHQPQTCEGQLHGGKTLEPRGPAFHEEAAKRKLSRNLR